MAAPDHVASFSTEALYPACAPLAVSLRTVLEYHPTRVFTSVLLIDEAPTRTNTSPDAGTGVEISFCQTIFSKPP
jgi:hypothetical protein